MELIKQGRRKREDIARFCCSKTPGALNKQAHSVSLPPMPYAIQMGIMLCMYVLSDAPLVMRR